MSGTPRQYSPGMNERFFAELSALLTQAGLAGMPETDIFSLFCDRCVAAGIPLGRAHAFIDTLHPVYEGRLFRWGYRPDESGVVEHRGMLPCRNSSVCRAATAIAVVRKRSQ